MEDKKIDVLEKFGLTRYESIAYISLCSLISAKATDISHHSNIPRSKVYDVLKSLHNKNFIEIEKTRPIKYTIIPPKDVFKKENKELLNQINEAEIELNEIYEDQISQVQAPMWLIHGEDKIIKKEIEIISRSKKSINMRIGFLFFNELEKLKEIFNKKNNIEINILSSPNLFLNNKKINLSDYFNNKNIIIKESNIPQVKMLIRDEIEILHVYSKFSDNKKKLIPNTSIGVWNQYEDIAKNYNDRFIKQFYKIKNK